MRLEYNAQLVVYLHICYTLTRLQTGKLFYIFHAFHQSYFYIWNARFIIDTKCYCLHFSYELKSIMKHQVDTKIN